MGSKESNPRWRKRGRKEEEGAAGRQGSGGRRGKLRVPVGKKKKSPGWVAFQEVSVVFVCAFTRGL